MSKFIKSTLALVTLALVCLVALTTVKAADADETREAFGTVIGIGKSPPPLFFACFFLSFHAFYLLSCLPACLACFLFIDNTPSGPEKRPRRDHIDNQQQ